MQIRQYLDVRSVGEGPSFYLPALVLGIISSGLYTLVPGLAYGLVLVAGASLLLNSSFLSSPISFIGKEKLAGFAVFNIFFFLHTIHYFQTLRTLYLHVLSIGMYVFALTFGRLFLSHEPFDSNATGSDRRSWLCVVLPCAALAVLLAGQIAELVPALLGEVETWSDILYVLSRRPGGFFNVNMTAAIALVLLFIANEASEKQSPGLTVVVMLAVAVVILSQSRIGVLTLFVYGFFLHARRVFLISVVLIALVVAVAVLVDFEALGRLVTKVLRRFAGDHSSQDRLQLAYRGLSAFLEAPLLGKGYRYVELTAGRSTHNEIIETLACYGLVGVVAIGLASYLLYWGGSARFLLVCAAPTFMFSHNFYETASFQTVLGLAFAVDAVRAGGRATSKRSQWLGAHGRDRSRT